MAYQNPHASAEPGKKALETPPPPAAAADKPAPPAACLENPIPSPDASSALLDPAIHGNAAAVGSNSVLTSAMQNGPVTDLQKKLRRAERFGTAVMLSEGEKRNSRAERFGTGSTLSGPKNVGLLEEQKRKARAERFGLKNGTVADEAAKKKARLERFATNSKMDDSSEDEKRKARAIRFSQGSPNVIGQVNSDLVGLCS
ncbi:unnamed protein product [Musa acuminata var. zebrina]